MRIDRVPRADRQTLGASCTGNGIEARANAHRFDIHQLDVALGAGGETRSTPGAEAPVDNVLKCFDGSGQEV